MSVSSTENDKGNTSTLSSPTEMDMEEETPSELFEINQDVLRASIVEEHEHEGSLFSFDFQNWNDRVFVAVGAAEESSSSMDALEWTLRHVVTPSTMVLLIHVFPVMRFIPSPLGMIPRHQVKPEMVQEYVTQERAKRKKLLQEFLNKCSASKVKVDVVLIESSNIAKAIVEIIPILKIRKLVIGTAQSSLRKPVSRRERGSGIANWIFQNALDSCDVKFISEGKEVIDQMIGWSHRISNGNSFRSIKEEEKPNSSFWLKCFIC
ncbi:U-box domain-containing protein 35-like [Quercus robur]|uniref:U-box domain-containing protein 35-like n=1 Tax=Quercus robur TaxID=38942 RepID=UPI0021635845|nr:U-box domain-containing protein 35-like [Quercus robur]